MDDKTEVLLDKVREMKRLANEEPSENTMLAQACLDDVQDILDK